MRITISIPPDRAPGLKVIPEIPDYTLCHLEGRNGIGKTVASRLLELATGGQPFAASPNAWRTLREQLGHTVVEVSKFPDGSTLQFHLNPSSWPETPEKGLTDQLGTVLLNGQRITWDEARGRLSVRRISGDETLLQTLARELEERGVRASIAEARIRRVSNAWEERLAEVMHLTDLLSRPRLQRIKNACAELENETAASTGRARMAVATLQAAETTADLARSLLARRDQMEKLLGALDAASRRLEIARAEVETKAAALTAKTSAMAITANVKGEIEHWESLRQRRRRALEKARFQAQQLERLLGLQTEPDPLTLQQLRDQTDDRRRELVAERGEIDLVGPLQRLASQVEQPLQLATQLVEQAIANLERSVTVGELLAGVQDRQRELDGLPRPGRLPELDRLIRTEETRSTRLRWLDAAYTTTRQKERLVSQAERKLTALFEQARKGDRDAWEEANDAVEAARQEYFTAAIEKRELAKELAALIDQDAPSTSSAQLEAEPVPLRSSDFAGVFSTGEAIGDGAALPDQLPDDGDDETPAANEDDEFYDHMTRESVTTRSAHLDAEVSERLRTLNPPTEELTESVKILRRFALRIADAPPATEMNRQLERLATWIEDLRRETTSRRQAAAVDQEKSHSARAELAEFRSRLTRACTILRSDDGDSNTWFAGCKELFDAAGGTVLAQGHSTGELREDELRAADALEAINSLATGMASAALQVPNSLAALQAYLVKQATTLSPRSTASLGNALASSMQAGDFYGPETTSALLAWLQEEFSRLLTAPEIVRELFDGSERVTVNLNEMTVLWSAEDGSLRKRPLEAFSSGEQVFAYTRANLARLAALRRDGQHLILFLDEFGAFVARDRLGQLMEFVEHSAIGQVADQVIVMLPLAQEYNAANLNVSEAAASGSGSEVLRAREVEVRGYFAVPFTSGRASVA